MVQSGPWPQLMKEGQGSPWLCQQEVTERNTKRNGEKAEKGCSHVLGASPMRGCLCAWTVGGDCQSFCSPVSPRLLYLHPGPAALPTF